MTNEETKEHSEIVQVVEAAKLDIKGLNEWAEQKGFQQEGPERYNWWYYKTAHGQLGYTWRGFRGVGRILFCIYIPQSTKKVVRVVFRGSTPSGVTLPQADLDAVFSKDQIESRVRFVCVAESDWAVDPEEVTSETRITEDLLEGEDEFKPTFLEDVFSELSLWFDFEYPNLEETAESYNTVGDIIAYVKQKFTVGV